MDTVEETRRRVNGEMFGDKAAALLAITDYEPEEELNEMDEDEEGEL
jgi:hypothetical protein